MATPTWALAQLSKLLPLDEESLKQILENTSALSKEAGAEHLKSLLGDSPAALEFITSYNARREVPKDEEPIPKASEIPNRSEANRQKKKKPPLHKVGPVRRPEDYGNTAGAYKKKDEEEYMPGRQQARKEPQLANALALSDTPAAHQLPVPGSGASTPTSRNASPKPKLPPSAAGSLLSDLPNVRTSRTSSPAPKAKIAISGGTPMHGASSTLSDLDALIRDLEIQTNPSLANGDPLIRRCNCMTTIHPLQAAAPNCLNCGKIICQKEGLGPCTFCGTPLLTAAQIQPMLRSLREDRGREKMDLNNHSQRKADVSKTPRPFQTPASIADDALDKAQSHARKLLSFQAENAQRTRVHDEAADFETPTSGQSMWASPVERAAQLKRQQKAMREMEWNAKPEYEKRVMSVDIVGGKVVKRFVERKREDVEEDNKGKRKAKEADPEPMSTNLTSGTGAFCKNPLLGGLIRPVWKPKDNDDKENQSHDLQSSNSEGGPKRNTWRRVQDDNDDNEAWILDGGVYGGEGIESRARQRYSGSEERSIGDACG